MNMPTRRSALLALASAAAAAPIVLYSQAALAQTTPTEPAEGADQSEYVTQTLTVGTLALQTSEIAVDKAENPMVKEFAQLEVGEQQAIASVLSATNAEPPALPEEMAAKVQTLADMEAGPEFDAAYVDEQIAGHEQLLEIQKMLSGETTATVEAITAKLAEQAVMSHLAMLAYIKGELGGAGPAEANEQPSTGAEASSEAEPAAPAEGEEQPAPQ